MTSRRSGASARCTAVKSGIAETRAVELPCIVVEGAEHVDARQIESFSNGDRVVLAYSEHLLKHYWAQQDSNLLPEGCALSSASD